MIFSEAVYIDENNILVPAGIIIRQKDIDKLKAWGITTVQSSGTPGFSGTDSKGENNSEITPVEGFSKLNYISSFSEVTENKNAFNIYMSLVERMNMVFLRISKGEKNLDSRIVNAIGVQLLQTFRSERNRFIGFILGSSVKGFDMAKSSVNIAILSALIAQELKFPHHKLLNLIIGALLHDAGMLRLPKEIIEKQGGLSEEERTRIRSHPLFSQRIVVKELTYPDEVGDIVLQHHERWDGNGYPFHFNGEKIDIGARIVTIADAFEAMVSFKPYRNPIIGNQAMKNLLADNSSRFDPETLKIFIMTMGIYPIGSIVQLNNGAIARVSDIQASAPLRPKVQILINELKNVIGDQETYYIDLLAEKNLYITKTMDQKELSEMV